MKFLCEGQSNEVRDLFIGIPEGDEKFTNNESFYFEMFHQQVYYKKEQKIISPIAVAVNVGDPELLAILLSCMAIPMLIVYRSDQCQSRVRTRDSAQSTVDPEVEPGEPNQESESSPICLQPGPL